MDLAFIVRFHFGTGYDPGPRPSLMHSLSLSLGTSVHRLPPNLPPPLPVMGPLLSGSVPSLHDIFSLPWRLIPMLVIFRVNDTVGNPEFYSDQLRQANIYNFIVNEALPSAINEMNMDGDNPGNAMYISQLKPHLASIA